MSKATICMTRTSGGPMWLLTRSLPTILNPTLALNHSLGSIFLATPLRHSTFDALASQLVRTKEIDETIYDVAIVGAGPGGVVAAICAAHKGLSALVIDHATPGGNADFDSRVEHDSLFPHEHSIGDLTIPDEHHSHNLSARLASPFRVLGVTSSHGIHSLEVQGHQAIRSRTLIVATGARYNRLSSPDPGRFEYKGLHYAATGAEAALCLDENIVVVGGGNSAGQAAVFLSGIARHVHLLVRGSSLAEKMGSYLVERILNSQHISLHTNTEIYTLDGDSLLRSVTWRHIPSGTLQSLPVGNLFVMIGAMANTGWLDGRVQLDENGFVMTSCQNARLPNLIYATCCPGIFAIGDARAGSVKRVEAAAKEGVNVISNVLSYLAAQGTAPLK